MRLNIEWNVERLEKTFQLNSQWLLKIVRSLNERWKTPSLSPADSIRYSSIIQMSLTMMMTINMTEGMYECGRVEVHWAHHHFIYPIMPRCISPFTNVISSKYSLTFTFINFQWSKLDMQNQHKMDTNKHFHFHRECIVDNTVHICSSVLLVSDRIMYISWKMVFLIIS